MFDKNSNKNQSNNIKCTQKNIPDNRIQAAMCQMLNEVDKVHLRELQAEMHRCAAKCCEDRESSLEFLHACVSRCSQNFEEIQKLVNEEFFNLQKSLQECVLSCNKEVRSEMAKYPVERQIKCYSSAFDGCMDKCIDKNLALIPCIMKKIQKAVERQVINSNSNKGLGKCKKK